MIDANTIVGGRYKVLRPLGGGGMKLVYLAEDLRLASRPCALAEMVDGFTNPDLQKQAVAAFQREADMLAQLSNEHIPRVFDRFSDQNRHYLVMEYIDGVTLEDRINASGGKLPEAEVIDVALQVLDTLEYLHGLAPPVIYRDLKPSNVMLSRNQQAKLIDFGIARHFQPMSNATMIGTQGYAPPEQYRGKVEARSDIYALGATMHHALSGRDPALEPPFSFPPLRSLCPTLTQALCDLVDDALKYDVVLRVPDAADFKRRLVAIRDGHPYAATYSPSNPNVVNLSGARQQQLPLGTPQAAPTPSAPTVLSDAIDASCPRCGRRIPIDSNFCSFCATNVTGRLGRIAAEASSEARTIVLQDVAGTEPPPPRYEERPRRALGPRHLLWIVGILVALALFAIRPMLERQADDSGGYSAPDGGSSAPDSGGSSAPEGGGESSSSDPRLQMLRQTLDAQGYGAVKFKMDGTTLVLWGSVPSEVDRMMVRSQAQLIAGVFSVEDHLQVRDEYAEP
jgi:serine/threonine protein kinase